MICSPGDSNYYQMGTLAVAGGASFSGTITATGLGITQPFLSYPLDISRLARAQEINTWLPSKW